MKVQNQGKIFAKYITSRNGQWKTGPSQKAKSIWPMKGCVTSLLIGEMQVEITIRMHFVTTKVVKKKNLVVLNM